MKKTFFLATIILVVLSACAAPAPAPTSVPAVPPVTEVPASTNTPEVAPTATETAEPTFTPLPTETPTAVPTVGPITVSDDFSTKTDIWGECENCTWENGVLNYGPFAAKTVGSDQIWYIVCEACGLHTYYTASADVTFLDGYGTRTYGVLAGVSEDGKSIGAATVDTYKDALYETYNFDTNQWGGTNFKKYNVVKAGRLTNHIEVQIKPSASVGLSDVIVIVNGTTIITLPDQPSQPTKSGLYIGWYGVGVIFDNFQYQETVP